jgi:hypothetical protein
MLMIGLLWRSIYNIIFYICVYICIYTAFDSKTHIFLHLKIEGGGLKENDGGGKFNYDIL